MTMSREYARAYYKKNGVRLRAQQRARYLKNREHELVAARRRGYKNKYGITIEEYETLFGQQGGHCALCPAEPKSRRLHVDHDHITGQVRGLLCFNCNTAIGYLGDSPAALERVVRYLEGFEEDA